MQDQPAEASAETLEDVAYEGFSHLDPTDSWLRIADLSPPGLAEFMAVTASLGLTILAVSIARRSVIDPSMAMPTWGIEAPISVKLH